MGKTYRLAVADSQGVAYADADGNIDVVAYVARKLDLDDQETYAVDFSETDGISGGEVQTKIRLTADGRNVAFLLARALRTERKAIDETPVSTPEESVTEVAEPSFA